MSSKIGILIKQDRPLRFLLSRLLARTVFGRWVIVRRPGYRIRLHPAALSMSLWEKPDDRKSDSQIIQRLLKPGDCCIDVGANIGHLTIEASLQVGPSGEVYAFEAHPRTCSFLRDNVALNRLTNVRIANVALSNRVGWARFQDRSSDDQNAIASDGEISVPTLTLDTLCAELQPVLLKIDVEGFELPVLQGARQVLARTRYIYFEAWEQHFTRYGYGFSELWQFLRQARFRVVREDSSGKFVDVPEDYHCRECVNLLAIKDADSEPISRVFN